ncbi:MAG: hypothetical protein AAB114_05950, partial [Chloroflexota bacterium]
MRRRALLVAIVFAIGLLWQPLLYPAGKAALLLLDIYSPILLGSNVAALVTPEPRERESRESIGGVEMRVSWWRPGWGDRHPGVMLVNGATPVGNDNSATRLLGRALARAGYLVMLPEFPFLVEGRLDPDAPRGVDAAFGALRALPETAGRPTGAFGASVGGGILLGFGALCGVGASATAQSLEGDEDEDALQPVVWALGASGGILGLAGILVLAFPTDFE